MRALLDAEPDFEVVGQAADAQTTLHAVRDAQPDVLLVDVDIPSSGPGQLVAAAKQAAPDTRVLVLSADAKPETIAAALAAGADAFIAKDSSSREVTAAIREFAAGRASPIPRVSAALPPRRRDAAIELMVNGLSARERMVLRHLAAGHSNARIAKDCQLTMNTVRTHVQSILVKLGVHSKVQAVWFAVQHNVVELPEPDEASDVS